MYYNFNILKSAKQPYNCSTQPFKNIEENLLNPHFVLK